MKNTRHRSSQWFVPVSCVENRMEQQNTLIIIPNGIIWGASFGDEVAATQIAAPAGTAPRHNDFKVASTVWVGTANVSRVDTDDKLLSPIPRNLHFQLTPFGYIRSQPPGFLDQLIIKQSADFYRPFAHGGVRLGRLDGQELGEHAGGLPVWQNAPEPGRELHQLGCRTIGADFLQHGESSNHPRVAVLAQHPSRVLDLHGAEDRSNATLCIVLDRPKGVAVGADPSKESICFHLLGHDGALQGFHDLLAVIDRQPDLTVAQALPTLPPVWCGHP